MPIKACATVTPRCSLTSATAVTVPFRVQAASDASPGVHLVALDVTLDGQRYGERFDLIVGVERTPVASQRDGQAK